MQRLLILAIGILLLGGRAAAQTDESSCPADFADYLTPRLAVGNMARVLVDVELNLRPQPGTLQARRGARLGGSMFPIIGGPHCAEGMVWWQADFGDFTGWIAEGSLILDEYWVEPRGQIVTIIDETGRERQYTQVISEFPAADGMVEPVGCLRPLEDYAIVPIGYAQLNARTLVMLDQAQRIYDAIGGGIVDFRSAITQGSYAAGAVEASFGTHDGGGAVDISVRSPEDWRILTEEIEPMIEAMRIAGFAAWLRDTGAMYPDSPIHIHAIAIGDAELSPAARLQIDGERGYLRGFNGLPEDYAPELVLDLYGGPILCGWMVEDGFQDLRESPET